MRGRAIGTLVVVAAIVAAGVGSVQLALPERASAGHQRGCGVVTKGSSDWRVRVTNLSCRKGRKGVRRYLRSGDPLRGYFCPEPADNDFFYCGKDDKSYTGQRL